MYSKKHSTPFINHSNNHINGEPLNNRRLQAVFGLCLLLGVIVVARLFYVMVIRHDFYVALAAGSQEIYEKLVPQRGEIFLKDLKTDETYPLAINKDYFIVYADTRFIKSRQEVEEISKQVSDILGYKDEERNKVLAAFGKPNDPYEPISNKVEQSVVDQLKELNHKSIGFIRKSYRYYPEQELASQVVGFLGKNNNGTKDIGRYGIEGYWEKELAGNGGFVEGIKAAGGGLLSVASKSFKPAENGADIMLTIDRTLQYKACERLKQGLKEYNAQSASLVVMDPYSGAIYAMCSIPEFDPNTYSQVESIEVYNNSSIFVPYEPGSIFKPIAMAAAINEELVTPNTVFHDSGVNDDICDTPIKNADEKVYGDTTMTGILDFSINTGMVYIAELLGNKKFRQYVEDFGFGTKQGVQIDSERTGTIASLSKNKRDKLGCYGATASFGQGLTATPLQMATAFSVIANGGVLVKPYIIDEIRFSNGNIERTRTKELRRVISKKTANLLSGMLVSVVDSGHAAGAAVDGYYIAGKTGTAQIPGKGGYTKETNHSFVGFGPINNPKFVMIVKFEKPERRFSASTAAPVFGDIAKFILNYFQVPPER